MGCEKKYFNPFNAFVIKYSTFLHSRLYETLFVEFWGNTASDDGRDSDQPPCEEHEESNSEEEGSDKENI